MSELESSPSLKLADLRERVQKACLLLTVAAQINDRTTLQQAQEQLTALAPDWQALGKEIAELERKAYNISDMLSVYDEDF